MKKPAMKKFAIINKFHQYRGRGSTGWSKNLLKARLFDSRADAEMFLRERVSPSLVNNRHVNLCVVFTDDLGQLSRHIFAIGTDP